MTTINRYRTARTEHACGWNCGFPIKPGERYVKSSLTPGDSDVGNIRWWHLALHGLSMTDCPCRECGGEGMVPADGCTCGDGISAMGHEPGCGFEPCPAGCPLPAQHGGQR